jgi:ketosteroid isomerase-like protein
VSHETVEVVRRVFDAFNRRDTESVTDLWTTDAEFRPAYIGGGLLEGAVFRGHKGLAEFIELQSETWDSVVAEPVEISDLGDQALVEVQLSAVGRTSGIPVDRVTWNVFRFRDGKVAIARVYPSKAEALKAVGLEE